MKRFFSIFYNCLQLKFLSFDDHQLNKRFICQKMWKLYDHKFKKLFIVNNICKLKN